LEGLAHAFLSLEDDSVVSYLCSEEYQPQAEHGINPLDTDLAISFEDKWDKSPFVFANKDSRAPSLKEAQFQGILPRFEG
jgi:dTDP-4-dehydrorhamnose 3,5-epimerase